MKNLVIAFIALTFLSSCKKESEELTQATHIFWFDEITADSLTANGYDELHLDVPFVELHPSDILRRRASVDDWESSEPAIQSTLLMIRYKMEPGDTTSFEYQIAATALGVTPENYGFEKLSSSSGRMPLEGEKIIYTKLEWK